MFSRRVASAEEASSEWHWPYEEGQQPTSADFTPYDNIRLYALLVNPVPNRLDSRIAEDLRDKASPTELYELLKNYLEPQFKNKSCIAILYNARLHTDIVSAIRSSYYAGSSVQKCSVCEENRVMSKRKCCGCSVCLECMNSYIISKIESFNMKKLQCPGLECDRALKDKEVFVRLNVAGEEKWEKLAQKLFKKADKQFRCHRCQEPLKLRKIRKGRRLRCECPQCDFAICRKCKAPWHDGLTCKEYMRGDQPFISYTEGLMSAGRYERNAVRCPSCRVWVQKISGCPHMECNRCGCHFCYKCGGRMFILLHDLRLSIVGCPYNFLPNKPLKRKLIRGLVSGLVIITSPITATLALLALPFFGAYLLFRRCRGH